MANFTAKDVNELRKSTGVGMMDCKKALTEADGDVEKAIELLREKGLATQAKKAGRVAAEGMVVAKVNADNSVGCVVEVNSETDFVANTDEFKAFVNQVADTIIEKNPADVEALKATTVSGGSMTVDEALQELFLKICRFAASFAWKVFWYRISTAAARSALWFVQNLRLVQFRKFWQLQRTVHCRLQQ